MRIISLNVNHKTLPRRVPVGLIHSLDELNPDILVLTEFVSGEEGETEQLIQQFGYRTATSGAVRRPTRGWCNQVLIASKFEFVALSKPVNPPTVSAETNYLCIKLPGITINAIRAPMYRAVRQWREYWSWLVRQLNGDLTIGDLNVDPKRQHRGDLIALEYLNGTNWQFGEPEGEWSYKGPSGKTSKIDHVLVKDTLQLKSVKYVQEPFWPEYTDHAALVVDIVAR